MSLLASTPVYMPMHMEDNHQGEYDHTAPRSGSAHTVTMPCDSSVMPVPAGVGLSRSHYMPRTTGTRFVGGKKFGSRTRARTLMACSTRTLTPAPSSFEFSSWGCRRSLTEASGTQAGSSRGTSDCGPFAARRVLVLRSTVQSLHTRARVVCVASEVSWIVGFMGL